jgi:peptidoglycan/LPS O-acetylase OafA/YrhL/lysophospholipase L1-like esterase
MPKPMKSSQRYMPGLDGLRALAVLAVIAFHEQFGWAPGGLLGVGVFFTLSGYLITDLLLGQWHAHGRLQLGDFWLRRARRLLPALFVMLTVVTAWVTLLDRTRLAGLRGAVAAAASYFSNWYLIAIHQSYFSRFAAPAPLDHLWSLAVEEQFYLAWPWLLMLGLLLVCRRRSRPAGWLALPTLALAAGSAVVMLMLYQPGYDPMRVYEGTDTRACGLLVGAALAMIWPSRGRDATSRPARLVLDGTGVAGLVVICYMIWRVGQYSPFAYRGGLVLLSFATAAVVAAAAVPGSVVGAALGWQPLRWIGVRSYGIYLWHYPVIVLTSPANSGENLVRSAWQIAASVILAALSWRFVEEPIRHGALGRMWARLRAPARRIRPAAVGPLAAATGASGVLAVACIGLAGVFPVPGGAGQGAAASAVGGLAPAGSSALGSVTGSPALGGTHSGGMGSASTHSGGMGSGGTRSGAASPPVPAPAGHGRLRTSCRAVAHIGDSTSDGLISPSYLPSPAQRIQARYKDVGVRTVRTDISGARSVVEVLPGQVNGYDAMRNLTRDGFRGCWVIALGTNDTADVAAGSQVALMTRVQRIMSAARGQPVMWVDVVSLLASGPYSAANMKKWNETLLKACPRYPNMRIFDWASLAKPKWFISDGIHYTSAGYAVRARQIADALARAFPAHGHSSGCVVT